MTRKNEQPLAVDVHVGLRLRAMRREKGLSQEALAQAVDLTFQQIQKYEKGTNRISASKLWQFAGILQKTVADFFDGLDAPAAVQPSTVTPKSLAIMAAPGGPDLVDSYLRMGPPMRRAFVHLAKVGCGGGA